MNVDTRVILNKLDKLKEPKILVVGDFGIDEMVFGTTSRISREAPVLILEHSKTKIILGTASNAAHNIATLNLGKVAALGVYGDDYYAKVLLEALREQKIDTQYMVEDKTRKTTTKTRISGSCSQSITQQIVRIDRQTTEPLSKQTEEKVIENLKKAIPNCDGVILSDYHLGFLTPKIANFAIEFAKKHNKIVVADAQKDLDKYKGATAITPNQPDCEKFIGYFLKDEKNLKSAGDSLIKDLNLDYVLLTRGENGMALFENQGDKTKMYEVQAFNKKEVFDVTGAGDTVVAAFTLALCANFSPCEAMFIGNLAASIVIRYFGCHSVDVEDLKNEIENLKGEEIYEIS